MLISGGKAFITLPIRRQNLSCHQVILTLTVWCAVCPFSSISNFLAGYGIGPIETIPSRAGKRAYRPSNVSVWTADCKTRVDRNSLTHNHCVEKESLCRIVKFKRFIEKNYCLNAICTSLITMDLDLPA